MTSGGTHEPQPLAAAHLDETGVDLLGRLDDLNSTVPRGPITSRRRMNISARKAIAIRSVIGAAAS